MPLSGRRAGRAAARGGARRPGRARRPRRLGSGRHRSRASTSATWRPTPRRSRVLEAAGVGVLSEESGLRGAGPRTSWWSSTRSTAAPTPPAASRGSPRACARSTSTGPRAALVVDLPHGRTFTAVRGGGRRGRRRAARAVGLRRRRRRVRRHLGPAGRHRWAGASSARWAPPPSTCARWPRARSTGTSTAARRPTARGTTWAARSCAPRPVRSSPTPSAATSWPSTTGARRTPVAAATPELLDALVAARPPARGRSTSCGP